MKICFFYFPKKEISISQAYKYGRGTLDPGKLLPRKSTRTEASNAPNAKIAKTDKDDVINSTEIVPYYDSFLLFHEIYPRENFQEDNELFTKNSSQIKVEKCKYDNCVDALEKRVLKRSIVMLLQGSKLKLVFFSEEMILELSSMITDYLLVLMGTDTSKALTDKDKKMQ